MGIFKAALFCHAEAALHAVPCRPMRALRSGYARANHACSPARLPTCLQAAINALAALQEAIKRTGVTPMNTNTTKNGTATNNTTTKGSASVSAAAGETGGWAEAAKSVDGPSRDCEPAWLLPACPLLPARLPCDGRLRAGLCLTAGLAARPGGRAGGRERDCLQPQP